MQLELVSLKIFHSMSLFDSTWDETILDRLCLDAAPTCVISTKWKWHKKAEKSERIYKYIFWASHNPIHDFFWCCFFLLHSHLKRYRLTIWVSFFSANVKIFPFLDWSRTVFDWELKHTWKKNAVREMRWRLISRWSPFEHLNSTCGRSGMCNVHINLISCAHFATLQPSDIDSNYD